MRNAVFLVDRYSSLHLGNLIFFHGLGTNVLALQSIEAINDLFEKRWQNYSSRPEFVVAGELMGGAQVCYARRRCISRAQIDVYNWLAGDASGSVRRSVAWPAQDRAQCS